MIYILWIVCIQPSGFIEVLFFRFLKAEAARKLRLVGLHVARFATSSWSTSCFFRLSHKKGALAGADVESRLRHLSPQRRPACRLKQAVKYVSTVEREVCHVRASSFFTQALGDLCVAGVETRGFSCISRWKTWASNNIIRFSTFICSCYKFCWSFLNAVISYSVSHLSLNN
jgi:hypothetical protein